MLLTLACLAYSAVYGTTPPTAIPAPVIAAADSLRTVIVREDSTPLLTVDALTRMLKFWQLYQHASPAVRDTGHTNHQYLERIEIRFTGSTSRLMMVDKVRVDLIAMATTYPSIAAAFKQAGLTPSYWERMRNALFLARLFRDAVDDGMAVPPTPASVVGQNIVFLKAHQPEIEHLMERAVEHLCNPTAEVVPESCVE